VIIRGDDPPYPPMSGAAALIAKTAIVSGPPRRTRAAADLGTLTLLPYPGEAIR
jgi:hypothetical protein